MKSSQSRVTWILGAVALVVLLVLPQQMPAFRVEQIITWMCVAVAAAGLNLLTGYNGQISVGHGALYGLGAYTSAILVTKAGLPPLLTVVLAAVVCFVAGLLIGLPALRIKGLYLALVTLAVATLFPSIIESFPGLTGGTSGLPIVVEQDGCPRGRPECPIRWDNPFGLADDQWRYYLTLAVTIVAFVIVANIVRSRVGRSLVAIRDNEIAASVSGIDLARTKIVTFGVSSAIAGVGGAMLALNQGRVNPTSFTLLVSIFFLVAVVIGGAATIIGPAVGAVVAGLFEDVIGPELPGNLENSVPVILGVLLIVQMLVAPSGIVGSINEARAKFAARHSGGDAAGQNGGTDGDGGHSSAGAGDGPGTPADGGPVGAGSGSAPAATTVGSTANNPAEPPDEQEEPE